MADTKLDCNSVYQGEENYPQNFDALKDKPTRVYYYGNPKLLKHKNILGIVGTRYPSYFSEKAVAKLIHRLQGTDIVIASGLARGVDSTAHYHALKYSIPTIAVLGSGLKAFGYNGIQKEIFEQLKNSKDSLVISEFEPEHPAQSWTFAHRNRLIAALSNKLLVAEAAHNSGSLITAKYAHSMNKQLLCFPGELANHKFAGNHRLINEFGAEAIFDYKQLTPP